MPKVKPSGNLKIIDCEQGSEDWHRARSKIPTASMFHAVMASGRGGGDSKTRRTYLTKLAGECLTGEPMENYSNQFMERGKIMEEEARNWYAFHHQDVELKRIGFITNGVAGCSPDSLCGNDGMLEIKTQSAHLLIETLIRDEVPPEHRHQLQGSLWVAEREWIDLFVYWPKMPRFIKRVRRDDVYIATIALEVEQFNKELAALVAQMRARQ
jgi:hypothetical protein